MPKLGVNIDHVATLRQARRVDYPSPVEAAIAALKAGADAITIHLREDRRHIQDRDVFAMRALAGVRLNQELAPTAEMVELAIRVRPHEVCFVPERREELTTEGGLDAAGLYDRLVPIIARCHTVRIGVSLFVDPEPAQIEAAARLGADYVELHTGTYASLADRDLTLTPRIARRGPSAPLSDDTQHELEKIRQAAGLALRLKLKPNAGHGLNYRNVAPIAAIAGLQWLHIGHSIVARAVMVGMAHAVKEMKQLVSAPRARR
jgi:pyridoxine 5-phosphate synthase